MAKKYYLVRTIRDGFVYARGDAFDVDIEGLALVRLDEYKDLDFKGDWSIIDVATGLKVFANHSRKKLLEYYTMRDFESLKLAIEKARQTDNYKKRLEEAKIEKKNWRESGYFVED